jgi:hypothetical protein
MIEEEAKHKLIMDLSGVVPMSAELIPSITDGDKNMLYTIACMKD